MKLKSILFSMVAIFSPLSIVLAQTLENLPGQEANRTDSDLIKYLDNLYKFGISITGILAIFMVGVGAFSYIVTSAGNSSKMIDAKETISNALIGLGIALLAYLFLFVINPDLVGGTLNFPKDMLKNKLNNVASSSGNSIDNIIIKEGGLADGTECRRKVPGPSDEITCPTCPSCNECLHLATFDNSQGKHCCLSCSSVPTAIDPDPAVEP